MGPANTASLHRTEIDEVRKRMSAYLHQQTVPSMGMNPQMELHGASVAIAAHLARAEALLAEVRGTDGANELLEAEIPPRQVTLRDGLDAAEVNRFEASQAALREVLRSGEIAT